MKLAQPILNALRRALQPVELDAAATPNTKRRTLALPSILGPFAAPGQAMPKPTPVNLRRFAETPVVRRAINCVKDRVAAMDWQIRLRRGYTQDQVPYAQKRMKILRRLLEEPNEGDSFRSFAEQLIEDALVHGVGAAEMELTGSRESPARLWPVDASSLRIHANWDGSPNKPHYSQFSLNGMTAIDLLDDQVLYMRMNPRTHTPFGLGPLEVAFETVNSFLSAHRFGAKLASNSVVQYALWINEATPAQHERLIRWWQDEVEGTGRVPVLSSEQKPEVLRFAQGTDADLRLNWQSFLIRMIANAFGLPPMLLGFEGDVNRSTAGELADEAFRSAIRPMACLLAEHITRDLFARRLGWREFEFVFNDLEARDEQTEVNIQTALLSAGVLTINEVRALRGLSPLPGDGTLPLSGAAAGTSTANEGKDLA